MSDLVFRNKKRGQILRNCKIRVEINAIDSFQGIY